MDARLSRGRRRLRNAMKLLALGLALLAAALAALAFDFNPTTLFIAGIACTFLGAVHLLSPAYGPGAGVSASDTSSAVDLVRANDRDSALRSGHGSNDHI
jgi:hypothetical protein